MKKLIILISALLLFACSKDNPTEPAEKTPESDSSFFFPLQAGNIWYYYEAGHSDATQSIRVWKSYTENDTLYVLYGNKEASADTLHQDQWGRVYKRFGGKNLLWLDFSAEDGSTYHYTLSEKLDYTVTVTRNQTITYDDQNFSGCIQFEFDTPDLESDELTYILAPDIGIIKQASAWNTKYLKTWELVE